MARRYDTKRYVLMAYIVMAFIVMAVLAHRYNMKRLHFFTNIGPIMIYAFIGTGISTIIIAILVYQVFRALCWRFL